MKLNKKIKKFTCLIVFIVFLSCNHKSNLKPDIVLIRTDFYTKDNRYVTINNKKYVAYIFKKITNLKTLTEIQTKPFIGSIDIEFIAVDKDGQRIYLNEYSTSLMIKPDNQMLFCNNKGRYIDTNFALDIIAAFKNSNSEKY